jgi:two-component system cell cycle sensor histidine kinase/response regulator CckA
MLESALIKHDYKVLVAKDADRAIQVIDEYDEIIHMLLTDVVMPGMSGVDLAEIVKKKVPHIKVVLMSGYAEEIVRKKDLIRPGYDFMEKPIIPSILAPRLRKIFDAR